MGLKVRAQISGITGLRFAPDSVGSTFELYCTCALLGRQDFKLKTDTCPLSSDVVWRTKGEPCEGVVDDYAGEPFIFTLYSKDKDAQQPEGKSLGSVAVRSVQL